MMDSATPHAERASSMVRQRSSRLREALAAARRGRSAVGSAMASIEVVSRKVWGVLSYELGKRLEEVRDRRRLAMLRRVLGNRGEWPARVPGLDFRTIYNYAEKGFRPSPSTVRGLLIRATQGTGDDIPYAQVFKDPTLGWASIVSDLVVVDVQGGHASMLQEPQVDSLVSAILPHVAGPDVRAQS
jgi:thioesterase domain-containing protein